MLNPRAPIFVPGAGTAADTTRGLLNHGFVAQALVGQVGARPALSSLHEGNDIGAFPADGVIATEAALRSLLARISQHRCIGLDCEGADLSRGSWTNGVLGHAPGRPVHGQLCLMQISTEAGECFAIDILALGAVAFASGLKHLLENPQIVKVVHDFRQDADALWHQFRVRPQGLIDCQLLDVLLRRLNGHRTTFVLGSARLFETNGISLEAVQGYGQLTQESKIQIHARFSADRHLWTRRPLPIDMVQYAKADVLPLLRLYSKLMQELTLLVGSSEQAWHSAVVGSAAYACDFRDGECCRCRLCCDAAQNARLDGYRLFLRMASAGCYEVLLQRLWREEDARPLALPGPSKFYVNDKDESVPVEGAT